MSLDTFAVRAVVVWFVTVRYCSYPVAAHFCDAGMSQLRKIMFSARRRGGTGGTYRDRKSAENYNI